MTDKLKLAVYCGAGCGGCDLAVLEIAEHVVELVAAADVVFWPTIADFKYADVRAMEDGAIDVCLYNGAIRTEENAEIARLLRAKSKVMVAFGSCSSFGGIPGLANLYSNQAMSDRVYGTESTDPAEGALPTDTGGAGDTHLPPLLGTVRALGDVVDVEYALPGCAPVADRVWEVCQAIVSGDLPAAPAIVGAGDKCVCDECALPKRDARVARFVRHHEISPEPDWCLLEQGIVCMGPATRSGCGAQCTSALVPCRGCYGPAGDATDQGAKMVAALGTIIDSEDEEAIAGIVAQIADPAGTFYCFTLPTSVMGRARVRSTGEVAS